MKLAKLLGAGKSFFGAHGTVSYRKDRRVYLPKFNDAEKNPFAPKSKEADTALSSAVVAPVAIPSVAVRPVLEMQKIAVPVPAPGPMTAVAKPARAGWADKLNPFRAPQPAPPMASVQPELSLDAVKVLHNDLSDADVEVVPVKSRTVAPVAAGRPDYLSEPVLRTI